MISRWKRILITWWAGFIWSYLVRKLVNLGFSDIHLILRYESDTWRINDILSKLHIHYWSLTDSVFVEKCVYDSKPDVIYHLAAHWVSGERSSIVDLFNNNINWTINLISACEKVWFEYFVNTWTNFEYWEKKNPFSESDVLEPNNEYAVSKASTTLYASCVWKNKWLPIYTYRLFSLYWPYETSVRLIPSLMLSYIKNIQPHLSKPDFVRDFIYIDDVTNYYLNVDLIEWDFWWIYNIWTWKQYSIWEIVDYIKDISNSTIEPIYGTMPTKRKELWMYMADTNKLYKTFNIKQRTIFEWLEETYERFKKNISLYK